MVVASRHLLDVDAELALSRYRHRVFVDRLGWDIPQTGYSDGGERDQFDRHDTVYVIRRDTDGTITGCARLLPTVAPYLLEKVFPELFESAEIPKSRLVWEMSRLAVESGGSSAQFMSGVREIFRAAVVYGRERKVERFVSVSFLAMERLLRRLGIHAHRAGPPKIVDGVPVIAFWVELDQQTFTALGLDENGFPPDIH